MTKEFEIGIGLLKRVQGELEELLRTEDKLSARRLVNAIVNPITAAAYQIRVGEGPMKDELLEVLLKVVKDMRELSDINSLKEDVEKLLSLVAKSEQEALERREG